MAPIELALAAFGAVGFFAGLAFAALWNEPNGENTEPRLKGCSVLQGGQLIELGLAAEFDGHSVRVYCSAHDAKKIKKGPALFLCGFGFPVAFTAHIVEIDYVECNGDMPYANIYFDKSVELAVIKE